MDQQNVGSKRSASGASGKIAAKSHEAAEHWKETVVDQANQVRDKARSAQEQAGERIRALAAQLQNASNSLHEQDPLAARLAERASRSIDGVAQYVSSASAQSLIRDTEQLARRQPALFFGGAFLLGLTAARFLKASSPEGSLERPRGYDYDQGTIPRPQDRDSGFFTPGESSTAGSPRYRENYNATFGRDAGVREPFTRETKDLEPNGTQTPTLTGTTAGRGERP